MITIWQAGPLRVLHCFCGPNPIRADFVRVEKTLYGRHAATLKWLLIIFVRLIQSQRIGTVMAKYGTVTVGYEFTLFFSLVRNLYYK
jgi:hypothetical protein